MPEAAPGVESGNKGFERRALAQQPATPQRLPPLPQLTTLVTVAASSSMALLLPLSVASRQWEPSIEAIRPFAALPTLLASLSLPSTSSIRGAEERAVGLRGAGSTARKGEGPAGEASR